MKWGELTFTFCLFLMLMNTYLCQETTTAVTVESEEITTEISTLETTDDVATTPVSSARKLGSTTAPETKIKTIPPVNCDKDWSTKDYLLEHPGFPYEYTNGVLCRYTVHKNSKSVCGLEITFRKFDIDTSPGCEEDFFAVGDERLCGHIPAQSVVQYPFDEGSDTIAMVFGTNDNVTKSGFQILFQQISICEEDLNSIPAIHACDVLITDPSGELVTHRTPEDALGDPVCRYTIGRRHSGYCQVELDFVDFNVEYSPGCISSYVQLDGHRFCGTSLRGQRKNVTFDSLGNIHIVYKTDTVRLDRGFHLLFRQLVCPSDSPVRSPGGTDLVGDRLPSSCSKVYIEKEFYVESPGFPNYYPNDLDCQLVIRKYRPSICKIDIRFLDFDVEDSPGCAFDFLQLDGQRLCGRIPEDNVRTTDFLSYEKILRFKTDSVNPRPGFFLYVRQLDCGTVAAPSSPISPSSCDVHVWDREARITSPNYPRDYGNDLRCRYTVHRQGDHICQLKVTFLDFKMQNGSPGCYSDYLEMDGGWRACGDKFGGITRTLDFRTSEKVLFFSSDSWLTYPGFLISLRQVPCSEATSPSEQLNGDAPSCDRQYEAFNFELRSELYPLNYAPNLNCRYLIRRVSESVCLLKFRFTHFDLETSVGCNRDYLSLDGQKLCGSLPINTTRTIPFDLPEKVVFFHSNPEIQASGFSAIVQQVECAGGIPPASETVPPSNTGRPSNPSTASTTTGASGSCNRHFTEIRSTFSSPNYPSPYPVGVACRYTFHMQPGFCNVEYTFIDFFLEPSGPGIPCTRDYLEIGGGRYCGQQLRGVTKLEPPYGAAREVTLTFFSDSVITDKGFLASFRQVPCAGAQPPPPSRNPPSEVTPGGAPCGGHLTGPYFEIKWPDLSSSTGDYGQTVSCIYNVHRLGTDTCSLRVTFITFDLGDGLDCPRQFVRIGEHTLCGRLPPYSVRDYNFHDYTMVIRATSSQLPRPRMHLQVQQMPCGGNSPPSRLPPPTCDETFHGPGFEIRSPYYPQGLSSSVDCRYIVRKTSPYICHLELTFERFELPDSRHCYASHLRIDADRLCGSIPPYSIRVYDFSTSEKLIHFSADHVLPGAGFVIKGRQVSCGGAPPSAVVPPIPPAPDQGRSRVPDSVAPSSRRCDQSYGLDEFTIFSPDHPSFYPSSVLCRYVVIRSGSDVCGLEVTFVSFELEDYYQCQKDYLDVDGERLCGVLPPQSTRHYVFHPADRTKVLIFRSDHSGSRAGFVLRIRQIRSCPASVPSLLPTSPPRSGNSIIPPPAISSGGGGAAAAGGGVIPGSGVSGGRDSSTTCETSYFSSPRGSFQSLRFPAGYPATHCIYTFVQLRGFCSLKLYFSDFDLLPSPECIVDYLELEGRRYCNGQLFQLTREVFFPWSDSSTLNVMFHSDSGSFVHRGYHVDFEQVPCRRQGRQHREELEIPFPSQNVTVRSSPSPAWTSSGYDEDWDDTKTTPKNSTVEYSA